MPHSAHCLASWVAKECFPIAQGRIFLLTVFGPLPGGVQSPFSFYDEPPIRRA